MLYVKKYVLVVCAFASVVSAYVVQSTPQLPDPGNTGVTKAQQEQLGQQAVAEVYKQMPVLPDSSPETQYVQQLGRKLVSAIPQQDPGPTSSTLFHRRK